MPGLGSCSRSAKWAWDRLGGVCQRPILDLCNGGLKERANSLPVVRTRPVCKHRDQDPRSGMWLPPSGWTQAHFAENPPGIPISRILGVGSHTKIPGIEFETRWIYGNRYGFRVTGQRNPFSLVQFLTLNLENSDKTKSRGGQQSTVTKQT